VNESQEVRLRRRRSREEIKRLVVAYLRLALLSAAVGAKGRTQAGRLLNTKRQGNNMKAAAMMTVGISAAKTSPKGEMPSLPKAADRID